MAAHKYKQRIYKILGTKGKEMHKEKQGCRGRGQEEKLELQEVSTYLDW